MAFFLGGVCICTPTPLSSHRSSGVTLSCRSCGGAQAKRDAACSECRTDTVKRLSLYYCKIGDLWTRLLVFYERMVTTLLHFTFISRRGAEYAWFCLSSHRSSGVTPCCRSCGNAPAKRTAACSECPHGYRKEAIPALLQNERLSRHDKSCTANVSSWVRCAHPRSSTAAHEIGLEVTCSNSLIYYLYNYPSPRNPLKQGVEVCAGTHQPVPAGQQD